MVQLPRPIPGNTAEVLENIEEQLGYNPNLIKQIGETYSGNLDPGAEAALAEQTIYRLWREFLQAYAEQEEPTVEHPEAEVRQTFEDFGDLNREFQVWWRDEGRELFIETGEIPVITVESIDQDWQGENEYPKHITLRIPLTVPKENIVKQFNDILKQCHMGSLLYRHRHSTAEYTLHPRSKYILPNFERMLRVWKIARKERIGKTENEQAPWWTVGQLAELAPGVDPDNDTRSRSKEESRRHLAKIASDLYDQAEAIMQNAIRGEFPKDDVDEPAAIE